MSANEMITLTVDGHEVTVPKGTNLIEAAKQLGKEIPHYCYHSSLSIVGNCRMCQVEVVGAPKLMIGCHTQVQPDMEVKTQVTSEKVKAAQESTLEMILINHPLDCTVCDQAGHCKLQDYHFEYNAKPSRFIENKVQKPKAVPLGPTVMLDAERCIMCTRCIRFCDEVTGTGELGMANRGDRSTITINPGKELSNPLSGSVVDLCPVGALTHKEWRFNTRIWYTKQTDTICPGCSTGCNVKVAVRDEQIVQVKARQNDLVNKEWLCDEGRYGFNRFIPEQTFVDCKKDGEKIAIKDALAQLKVIKGQENIFFLAPELLLEDFYLIKQFIAQHCPDSKVAVAYRKRELTSVEAILISPDYAANYKSAEFLGLISDNPGKDYEEALAAATASPDKNIILVGDRAILAEDQNDQLMAAIKAAPLSALIGTDANSGLYANAQLSIPSRSIFQKSGLLTNKDTRFQYSDNLIAFAPGTHPEWRVFNLLAKELGSQIVKANSDREMTLELLASDVFSADESGAKPTIRDIKTAGLSV